MAKPAKEVSVFKTVKGSSYVDGLDEAHFKKAEANALMLSSRYGGEIEIVPGVNKVSSNLSIASAFVSILGNPRENISRFAGEIYNGVVILGRKVPWYQTPVGSQDKIDAFLVEYGDIVLNFTKDLGANPFTVRGGARGKKSVAVGFSPVMYPLALFYPNIDATIDAFEAKLKNLLLIMCGNDCQKYSINVIPQWYSFCKPSLGNDSSAETADVTWTVLIDTVLD